MVSRQKYTENKNLADKDIKARKDTILSKSFELSLWGTNCHVETTVCVDGKYSRFRSRGWTSPTMNELVIELTEGDYLTQNQAKYTCSIPSNGEDIFTSPAETTVAGMNEHRQRPAAKSLANPVKRTFEAYGDYIRAHSPYSDTSDERVEDRQPVTPPIRGSSSSHSRLNNHNLACHAGPGEIASHDSPLITIEQNSDAQQSIPSIHYQTPPLSHSLQSSPTPSIKSLAQCTPLPSEIIRGDRSTNVYSPSKKGIVELEFDVIEASDLPEPPQLPRSLSTPRKRSYSLDGAEEFLAKKPKV